MEDLLFTKTSKKYSKIRVPLYLVQFLATSMTVVNFWCIKDFFTLHINHAVKSRLRFYRSLIWEIIWCLTKWVAIFNIHKQVIFFPGCYLTAVW